MAESIRRAGEKQIRFLTKVWKEGKGGKLLVSLYSVLSLSPLLVEALAIYSLRAYIFPLPSIVLDRIAVLSFLAASLFFLASWFGVVLVSMMADLVKD